MDHVIIDLRQPAQESTKELEADLIIEIDLYETGYDVEYSVREPDGSYRNYNIFGALTREKMVLKHVDVIRDVKPKTVVVRTGRHSTGHVKDIPIHPGVVKNIINGTFDAAALTLGN